ncbi:MFS transporter [Sphingosinicella sp. LHD-64]|uniref:MFS transporter n=1 Tax=Sphingosinicella sp. LHD-64 TaxID=3072139 RepID=UPI00280CB3AC|nr:MFS transporter [Sphingosinicella sp. LHD-64]MDQ8758213.1 MFS transporter [Sphingosinicella sp. LHD-64]
MTGERIARPRLALGLVVAATVLGIMGTDLVLPAVPSLPETLGGDAAAAQLVLAAYVAGTGAGLLAFGALGDRFATRTLVIVSLLLTGLVSFACAWAPSIGALIAMRAAQGAVAAGPAVFAPAIARAMFDEAGAVRAIGALGSIESLAPALAPILGVWLLAIGGWELSFELIGAIALALAALNLVLPLVPQTSRRASGSYGRLVGDPVFLRYALSQACVLGGLLVFVFGAPAVLVRALGGTLADFIVIQLSGITTFILAANVAGSLARRFGAERMIWLGTLVATAGAAAILGYALIGGTNPIVIAALFVPINTGLGLRGPPGFYRAVIASHGDDARGSALVILAIMAVTAFGTAAVAPFIEQGLVPLGIGAFVLELAALACLAGLPPLPETE